MNRVLIKLWREGNCFLWSDFWDEFKANILKALPFGIVCGLMLFASYYFLSLSVSYGALLTTVIGFMLLGFAVLFGSYAFVFLPTLDLKIRHIARNAFILAMVEWKTNLVLLGCVIGTALLSAAFFPYTIASDCVYPDIVLPAHGLRRGEHSAAASDNRALRTNARRRHCNNGNCCF